MLSLSTEFRNTWNLWNDHAMKAWLALGILFFVLELINLFLATTFDVVILQALLSVSVLELALILWFLVFAVICVLQFEIPQTPEKELKIENSERSSSPAYSQSYVHNDSQEDSDQSLPKDLIENHELSTQKNPTLLPNLSSKTKTLPLLKNDESIGLIMVNNSSNPTFDDDNLPNLPYGSPTLPHTIPIPQPRSQYIRSAPASPKRKSMLERIEDNLTEFANNVEARLKITRQLKQLKNLASNDPHPPSDSQP